MIEPRKKHPYVKLGERIKSVRESIDQFKNIDNFSKATDIKKGNLYNYFAILMTLKSAEFE